MINNKYDIGDRVWYILDGGIRSYEIGEIRVAHMTINYASSACIESYGYIIQNDKDLFHSEEEAKQELKKQLQDKINKL